MGVCWIASPYILTDGDTVCGIIVIRHASVGSHDAISRMTQACAYLGQGMRGPGCHPFDPAGVQNALHAAYQDIVPRI